MGTQEENYTLEEHIILRLPLEEANELRAILHNKPYKLKKLLKIDMDPNSNRVTIYFNNKVLLGTLQKFPTVIESYKTNICNNKSVIFKTADVSHFVECGYEDPSNCSVELSHGYCPPLKNVKRNRFRRTMFNQDFAIEAEMISKELYYILNADLEAISTRFEIINDTSENKSGSAKQEEYLFGEFTSSSEQSDSTE